MKREWTPWPWLSPSSYATATAVFLIGNDGVPVHMCMYVCVVDRARVCVYVCVCARACVLAGVVSGVAESSLIKTRQGCSISGCASRQGQGGTPSAVHGVADHGAAQAAENALLARNTAGGGRGHLVEG